MGSHRAAFTPPTQQPYGEPWPPAPEPLPPLPAADPGRHRSQRRPWWRRPRVVIPVMVAAVGLAVIVAAVAISASRSARPARQVSFTGCTYVNTVPAPDNGFNGGPGSFTIHADNNMGSPVTLHSLTVQFTGFTSGQTYATETVRPDVTVSGNQSRELSFTAPRALYALQQNDPQAYGNSDGSDITCSQAGWS
jgi:hypothetical protein